MIQVQIVSPDAVYSVWDKVKPFLEAAHHLDFEYTTVEQIKLLLVKGIQNLFIGVDDTGEIVGAMVTEFINYPNERVLFITEIGGKGIVTEPLINQIEDWARQNGATRMCAWADAARARLYQMKSGFTTARHVVEKKL